MKRGQLEKRAPQPVGLPRPKIRHSHSEPGSSQGPGEAQETWNPSASMCQLEPRRRGLEAPGSHSEGREPAQPLQSSRCRGRPGQEASWPLGSGACGLVWAWLAVASPRHSHCLPWWHLSYLLSQGHGPPGLQVSQHQLKVHSPNRALMAPQFRDTDGCCGSLVWALYFQGDFGQDGLQSSL